MDQRDFSFEVPDFIILFFIFVCLTASKTKISFKLKVKGLKEISRPRCKNKNV